MITVNALICASCGDAIYSRARHDCRSCTCGDIYVDGGFDYVRAGFRDKSPENVKIEVDATKQVLYNDWNNRIDKFGLIRHYK